jgi:hypothetical protein
VAVPLGIALVWLGYSIGYYGWNRITGGNDTFTSLVYPGRYSPTTRDSGAGGPAPAAAPGSQSPAKAPAQQGTNPNVQTPTGATSAATGGAVHP